MGDIVVDVNEPALPQPAAVLSLASAEAIEPPLVAPGVGGGPEAARDETEAPEPASISVVGDHTAVFAVPTSDGPRATLRELRPDGTSRTIAFDGRPLTIGRAPDNGLVVRDGRASRHHARIDGRRGTLVLSDLGSSNGSFVNDRRVESVALGAGDRIRIGTTAFVVERLGEDQADGSDH
jgi:hypothetical protein